MKSILISIQPKWVEKICHEIGNENGKPIYEKVVEVRKSRPKLETPFKCYIYMTKNGSFNDFETDKNKLIIAQFLRNQGKVIGEFVCDKIIPLDSYYFESADCIKMYDFLKETCLSWKQFNEYANGKEVLWGWHISNLKIYDKPKELSEFGNLCRKDCLRLGKGKSCEFLSTDGTPCNRIIPIKRPPQSWCYVESLGE